MAPENVDRIKVNCEITACIGSVIQLEYGPLGHSASKILNESKLILTNFPVLVPVALISFIQAVVVLHNCNHIIPSQVIMIMITVNYT